ncbi:MBL fold metallo-hydrolase [Chloroflexi bacterium TSY]|nr:MBL fold metallo-hydrolase [Chloroflexi bacterium TSY]
MQNNTIARLYILDFGLFQVHSNGRIIGIQGYLIQTHTGTNILVDTGFPAKYADDTEMASEEDELGDFGHVLRLTKDNLPLAQLARCGLKPSDIDILIMSHTHRSRRWDWRFPQERWSSAKLNVRFLSHSTGTTAHPSIGRPTYNIT